PMEISISSLIAAIAVMAAPLVLASLGETLTEKVGVVNLSLDGTILLGAMTGFVIAVKSGSLLLGFTAATAAGASVAALLAITGVRLGQSQVAVGFALTFLCRDLAYFLGNPYSRQQGPQLEPLPIPILSKIPLVGEAFFSHSIIVYLSFLAIPGCCYFLYRTRAGLILRSVGENPHGCWARGINPVRVQTLYTIIGGGLVGLAGAAFSLSVKPGWGHPQGCEGIGWIALALVIFGGWHPLRVAAGAYFFGLLQLLGIYFQDYFTSIPPQIFQVAPFPLMICTLVLINAGQRSRNRIFSRLITLFSGVPPEGLGRPYKQ
ncbi:MAG: ABC transporter permease, partial [Deltaproteobacteria bacterium]|nr:ABC transporter permease [Deltaproteobacteria bacterium]